MAEYDQILRSIQLFDDLHLLQSIQQVYQTQDENKVWPQSSHSFLGIPNSLAAQVPLDLRKASEITPVWVCRPRRVVVPNLGWHVGSLHGVPGRCGKVG